MQYQTPLLKIFKTTMTTVPAAADEVKYKGVRLRKWGKYVSEIRLPNSRDRIWLGSYATAEEAARAFDAALFCLRGAGAKFNFPDDPPSIVGGGRGLKPEEIRAVARNYAFSFGSTSNAAAAVAEGEQEVENESPTSNSEGAAETIDSMDWSVLEELDWGGNSGGILDFDWFNLPPLHSRDRDDEDDDYVRLWNF